MNNKEREEFLILLKKIYISLLGEKNLVSLEKFIIFLEEELSPEEMKEVSKIQVMITKKAS